MRRSLKNQLPLSEELKPTKRTPRPPLERRDGSRNCCNKCDLLAEYAINGELVCLEHGDEALKHWADMVRAANATLNLSVRP